MLTLPDDDLVGREVGKARERALEAVLESLEGDASALAEGVRRECTTVLGITGLGGPGTASRFELRRRAVAAARKAISQLRSRDEIGDAAFHRLEEELDWVEMTSTPR